MAELRRLALSMLVCLAANGCTTPHDGQPGHQRTQAPQHSHGPLETLERYRIGERITLTAVVTAVISAESFVLGDVDLPERGLLILGGPASGVRNRSLVTVRGTIDRFEFERLASQYRLGPRERYEPFAGRKVALAGYVHSWA